MSDPIQQQSAQQMQQLAQAMGGKPGFIITPFGPISMDWNVSGPFAMQSCSPLAKNVPALGQGTGKAGGLGDKFLQACMQAGEQLREINRSTPIVVGGDIQNAGGGGLGGFGRGGGFELG